MDMTGEFRIPAPRDTVWRALNDPEVLKRSIPGCEEIVKLSDTELTAKVSAKVGPVSARFTGKVTLSDLDPPSGYRISGEGQGGVAGFAKGGTQVRLAEDGGSTVLSYTAQAQVGGKLAQIGSRLVDATARKMAEEFFTRFAAQLAPPATPAAEMAVAEAAAPSAAQEAPEAGIRVPPLLWVAVLTGVVGVLLYLFTRG